MSEYCAYERVISHTYACGQVSARATVVVACKHAFWIGNECKNMSDEARILFKMCNVFVNLSFLGVVRAAPEDDSSRHGRNVGSLSSRIQTWLHPENGHISSFLSTFLYSTIQHIESLQINKVTEE